jgi:hypothetical protein
VHYIAISQSAILSIISEIRSGIRLSSLGFGHLARRYGDQLSTAYGTLHSLGGGHVDFVQIPRRRQSIHNMHRDWNCGNPVSLSLCEVSQPTDIGASEPPVDMKTHACQTRLQTRGILLETMAGCGGSARFESNIRRQPSNPDPPVRNPSPLRSLRSRP